MLAGVDEAIGDFGLRETRHLTGTPHPQPLSHRMGEGSVGLSPIEAERGTGRRTTDHGLPGVMTLNGMHERRDLHEVRPRAGDEEEFEGGHEIKAESGELPGEVAQ